MEKRLTFFKNGEALVGLVLLLAGLFVIRDGFLKLKSLWFLFAPNFPVSMQEYTAQRILTALPFVFGSFVSIIASLCAILIGLLWAGTGLAEAFRSSRTRLAPGDFKYPDLIAESLRVSRPQHRQPRAVRVISALFPQAQLVSPVAYELFTNLMRYCAKLFFTGIVIGLAFYMLRVAPLLINRYFHMNFSWVVPSAKPLYLILGFIALGYILIGLSLVFVRREGFGRTAETFQVIGKGDPHLFFALLEEGCRLLTQKSFQQKTPVRLQLNSNPRVVGTLIENYPESVHSWGRPAAYACLPIFFLLLTSGFGRLIDFRLITQGIPYNEFIRLYLLDYLLEVAIGLTLIITGLQLADLTRRLFGVRKFCSTAVFSYVGQPLPNPPFISRKSAGRSGSSTDIQWKIAPEVDEHFAYWARQPETATSFRLNICWAEIFSESITAAGPRLLTGMLKSPKIEAAMERILRIPLTVNFEIEAPQTGVIKEESSPDTSLKSDIS